MPQYRPGPDGVELVTEYRVGPAAELVTELAAGGEDVVLAGDGVRTNRAAFESLRRAVDAGQEFEAPSATALVELAARRVGPPGVRGVLRGGAAVPPGQ